MTAAAHSAVAASPAVASLPHGLWLACSSVDLPEELTNHDWTLVELRSPGNLYARLLSRIRIELPQSHSDRLHFLCSEITDAEPALGMFSTAGLPALVLCHRASIVRRWFGALDLQLLRYEIDLALVDLAR